MKEPFQPYGGFRFGHLMFYIIDNIACNIWCHVVYIVTLHKCVQI